MKIQSRAKELKGNVAVCTAGTADIPVAEEAAQTAEFFGAYVERIYDVGESAGSTDFSTAWIPSRKQTAWWRWPVWRELWPAS